MPKLLTVVEEHLKRYGWQYEVKGENVILTGFRSDVALFRIFMQVMEKWIIAAIVPFVPRPLPECRSGFYAAMARLNYEMNFGKMSVDPDGDIALTVEIPVEELRFEYLTLALDALSAYAVQFYVPLSRAATDPAYTLTVPLIFRQADEAATAGDATP